jgi:predicted metalloprotease with PDZ domain
LRPVAYPLIAAAALFLTAAKPPEKPSPEERPITFRMHPVAEPDGTRTLQVEMRFRGDSDGETALFLPSEWAGSDELWRHVEKLEIRGARKLGGTYDAPIITHRPGAKLKVRYKIVSAWQEDPGFAYEKARPMVRPDWFFVHGETFMASVGGREAAPAKFRWGKIPKGWTVASDLDHLINEPSTLANLINSVAIGGTGLRVVKRDVGGAPLTVAVAGEWSFTPEALTDMIAPIVAAEDAFWGDRSTPFFVAMAPLGTLPAGLTYTGTGRTDGFSVASTSAFDLKIARRFLAHEYMHSWVPNMMGTLPEEAEAQDYWFSEGFTDYLATKVLLRSGQWTLEEWVADKNETLLRYGTSPAKTVTGEDIAVRFWVDQAVQQVSYDRGHLLAARLDAEIAARSGGRQSLDDVLRAQRPLAEGNEKRATDLFRATLLDKTGIDVAPDIEKHARRGEAIVLAADLLGDCARIVPVSRKEFHRGYDAATTRVNGGVISGVVEGTNAHVAGLRNGQRLVNREAGKMGDSTVEIAYRVSDDGGEKVVRYMPEGKGTFEVQQLVLTAPTPEAQARCKARLGGGA